MGIEIKYKALTPEDISKLDISTEDIFQKKKKQREEVRLIRPCAWCGKDKHKPKTEAMDSWLAKECVWCSRKCMMFSIRKSHRGYLSHWLYLWDIPNKDFFSYLSRYSKWNMSKLKVIMKDGITYADAVNEDTADNAALRIACAMHDIDPTMKWGNHTFDHRLLLNAGKWDYWPFDLDVDASKGTRGELLPLLTHHGVSKTDFMDNYLAEFDRNVIRASPGSKRYKVVNKLKIESSNPGFDNPTLYGEKKDANALKIMLSKGFTISARTAKALADYLAEAYDLRVDYRMLLSPITTTAQFLKAKRKLESKNYW